MDSFSTITSTTSAWSFFSNQLFCLTRNFVFVVLFLGDITCSSAMRLRMDSSLPRLCPSSYRLWTGAITSTVVLMVRSVDRSLVQAHSTHRLTTKNSVSASVGSKAKNSINTWAIHAPLPSLYYALLVIVWLFRWVGFSYKNWLLLASNVKVSVGVDVLTSEGGVFFRPWIVVWVNVRTLEDCLVIGGIVRIFFACL